jgi:uncharacterized membrane protein YtjA (UPF0391 family)
MPRLQTLLVHQLQLVPERLELLVAKGALDEGEEVVFFVLDMIEDELPQGPALRTECRITLLRGREAHERVARDRVLFERLEDAVLAALVEALPHGGVEDLLLDHEVCGERVGERAKDVRVSPSRSLEALEELLHLAVLTLEQRGRFHARGPCERRAARAAASGEAWHARCTEGDPEGGAMLYYALVFFVIALIAGFLGFFGIASDAAWIAKILFVAFLVLAVVSLLVGRRRVV